MTRLSAQLQRLKAPRLPAVPSFEVSHRCVERVLKKFDRPPGHHAKNPDALLAIMRARIAVNDWRETPMSFVIEVAGLVFAAPWRDQPEHDDIRQFLLSEIAVSRRPGFLNPMMRIYLENFDKCAAAIHLLARALAQIVEHLAAQWQQLYDEVSTLFSPNDIADELAKRMAGMPDIWRGLRDLGFRHPHSPGLMGAAHLAYLEHVGPDLKKPEEIDRLFAWLQPQGQRALEGGASEAITALLEAWDRQPPADILRLLIDRISELYGHPKVNRKAIWNRVPPELEARFLHWLSGAHIRLLFSVLDEVEKGHMWRDREDFWWTLYEQGRIDEVWIAFNEAGFRTASERLPEDTRKAGNVLFARQAGEPDKSLLLMRIGRKIVVEGTYSWKVHVFDAGNPAAPKLYQPKYDNRVIRDLRGAETYTHLGNAWKRDVMKELS